MRKKILFVSHPEKNCGVHEYGTSIFEALKTSEQFEFIYVECSSLAQLEAHIKNNTFTAVIYNYHPSTLPWLTKKVFPQKYKSLNKHIIIPQIGIMHEVTQQKADIADTSLFDYHIAPDPTLLLKNRIVFKTGRIIPSYENSYPAPEIPVIGSFGFATPNKGFELIVKAVEEEFDQAVIRFNIPSADFADRDGSHAKELVAMCRKLITKRGISIVATHEFLNPKGVLDFLAQNTLNIFLYQDKMDRGLSSTVDYALAVNRPLAISDSVMFRHLHRLDPSIIYKQSTLKEIINNGTAYVDELKKEWSIKNLVWNYERILNTIFKIQESPPDNGVSSVTPVGKIKNYLQKILFGNKKDFTWLRNTQAAVEDDLNVDFTARYIPVAIPFNTPINRILDNKARELYTSAIQMLESMVPLTMAKKISEANVQQAFVFDTAYKLLNNDRSLKILCVGSYEDTAAMTLKKMGFTIEEIDPVINYTLQDFYTKPTTQKGYYDIIFSTSVIEHDPDDESFIRCVEGLLKLNGTAIITCDYKDGWKPGDLKPDVDARFYTKYDLENRLPSLIPNCVLVDAPQWECEHPDFTYLGKYQYTFATFVFKKVRQ